MNQKEYYKIGTEKNLPLRCPILNYCGRRACTIYFNSEYAKYDSGLTIEEALLKDGTLPSDFREKKIDIQGAPPSWIRSNTHYFYEGMCPEVNLFDSGNSLYPDVACVSAKYDKDYNDPKCRVLKTQHFSECAEFNKYVFDAGLKRSNVNKKPRKTIPAKSRALLQKEIKSLCPFCANEDVEHFHIHHIDENPINNEFVNLLMLCPTCHSKITKSDIKSEEVVRLKNSLQK